MISILVEVQEKHTNNSFVWDLLSSFGQGNIDDAINLKMKKSRRKHFKELMRLKRLGVLGKRNPISNENRTK